MTMAGKGLRDAATLILTAKSPVGKVRKTLMLIKQKYSALFCFSELAECYTYFDYKEKMLKKSSKGKFVPNTFVFHEGVIAVADFASRWKDHLISFGI